MEIVTYYTVGTCTYRDYKAAERAARTYVKTLMEMYPQMPADYIKTRYGLAITLPGSGEPKLFELKEVGEYV